MVRAQVQELVTAQPVMTPLWAAPEVQLLACQPLYSNGLLASSLCCAVLRSSLAVAQLLAAVCECKR